MEKDQIKNHQRKEVKKVIKKIVTISVYNNDISFDLIKKGSSKKPKRNDTNESEPIIERVSNCAFMLSIKGWSIKVTDQ